ncbi:DUF58 domain-containing protein [Ureibacillus chungkukjangi]|uniref:Uncharacterized protein (DUF58 family) n=1 Tax=Ureibacillus chungkukjangi TaxID=1202712 RepID=A0A318TKJ1_9BACL|nr:DUF58 domain-containing protein [Ureibacillus chungkukjangi]MCM3389475.1 DUF58 domain-containing protein [Ureibacillus chungkukjangi]PYF04340.1 uncharacterized protein (DUF58 family) [Ureibacillus chungkukjangi]
MKRLKNYLQGGGRFIAIIVLAVITFSYAMFQGGFVSWFVFYSLTPFLLYSLLLAFAPIHIYEVSREVTPSKLHRGDSAKITVSFRNKTWIPLIFMTVQELGIDRNSSNYQGRYNQIYFVGWKRKFEWSYELNDMKRGKMQFQGIQFTFTDFFGWTIRTKVVEEDKSVVILPKLSTIKYKPLQMQFEHGGVAAPFSMVKDTSLVTGVRDYQSGDKYSWIHWKSFAKNETLRTKEFEDRQTQDIFLAIDQSSEKNFEHAVDLTASILQSVIKNHGDISFLSTGEKREIFPKLKSQSRLEKVMQHLAVVKPDSKQSIDAILANEMALINAATLVLVTGELSKELKDFFVNSSKFARGIVCFVVSGKNEKVVEKRLSVANVKVIHIAEEQFENAFTEVMKP